MLVLVLVFGITLVGCADPVAPKTPEADTWTNVTSLSQLNGTWKGSYSQTETDEEGITVKTNVEMTVTFNASNASTGTMSGSMKMTMTISGNGISEMWPDIKESLKESLKESFDEDDFTFNDSNHSVSMIQPMPSTPVSLSEMGVVQINQNGKKLKTTADGDGLLVMIFEKQ